MDLLDRLHKVFVAGVGGAVGEVLGFGKDLASAPFTDDEYEGLVNTIYRVSVKRGGNFLGRLFGPETGLGAAAGAIPRDVRAPFGAAAGGVGSVLETAYREGVAEPLSTAFTAGSLASRPGSGFGELFRPATWREAYGIAQDRSPGQAFALAFLTRDIRNPAEVAEAMSSDGYEITSGISDALARLFVDPTVVAGKAAAAARTAKLVRPIRDIRDVQRMVASGQMTRFAQALEGRSAAEIRQRWFRRHAHGGPIAHILASAEDSRDRYMSLRALAGDPQALEVVRARRADLAGEIGRLVDQRYQVAHLASPDPRHPGLFDNHPDFEVVSSELATLYPEYQRLSRIEAHEGTLRRLPRPAEGGLRERMARSETWQSSPVARPLHAVYALPQRMVDLHNPTADVQVARLMRYSELPLEAQNTYRSRYMAAATPTERQQALVEAEDAAVSSIAEAAGMTTVEIQGILDMAAAQRGRAAQQLQSRAYDAQGRSRVRWVDEDGAHEIDLPLWVTQESNLHPVVDILAVRQAAIRVGRFRARHANMPLPADFARAFYRIWKPSVLFRVGWPMRVVADEQLRIMAKIGTLVQMRNLQTGVRNWAADFVRGVPRGERGLRPLEVNGYTLEGAFGLPGDANTLYRQLVDANASFRRMFGQEEDRGLAGLRRASGNFQTITPDSPDYARSWEWAVNNQIAQDVMGRRFLEGETPEDVLRWLTTTAEGQSYAQRIPVRAAHPEQWVGVTAEQVAAYLPTEELRRAALTRNLTISDLEAALPDAATRPLVHGEMLTQALGNSPITRALDALVRTGYNTLGRVPTNVLSRNPFFDHMYRAEATRLTRLLDDGELTSEKLASISQRAREYALDESRHLLYDLAESSRLQEMLRFWVPFYGAWQEVLTRWAGLVVENPAFVARMRQVWQAPEKAGLITDENGRPVEWGQVYVDGEIGSERFITLPVPEWVTDLPGMSGLTTQGSVRFNRRSFNLVLQGAPGFGPPVQVPVNEIVKHRPELEEAMEFVLPFGSTRNIWDLLLPATAKRAFTRVRQEEDRQFLNTMVRIYMDKVVDYELGKRDDRPTYEEARREARALYNLRIFASWTSPAAPSFTSPYQLYIDAYRQAQRRYAEDRQALADSDGRRRDPDEWFLDTYGREYFALTQSLSRSMDGVPPTVEAFEARGRYKDLIEQYPEFGSLIIGQEGAGEFSGAVYDAQLDLPLKPGSSTRQRERPDFHEAAAGPTRRLGWVEYRRISDLVEAERVRRGLPSLAVKGARDLRELKGEAILALKERYPEWYEDFAVVDRAAWERRIAGLSAIAADPRLAQRDEIKVLRDYLEARATIVEVLSRRKFSSLDAADNADVMAVWKEVTAEMVERSLPFADLFYRWLEFDPLEVPREAKQNKKAA